MAATTELFDQDEITIIQCRQLRKTVHYLYQRSPFYRDLFDRNHIIPAEIKTLEDLAQLPTVSRDDLIREGERFLCVRPEEMVEIIYWPGADQRPLLLQATDADLSRMAYSEQLSLKTAGIGEKDIVALAVKADEPSPLGLAIGSGLRRLGAAAMRCGHLSATETIAACIRAKATVMLGTAARLLEIAEACKRQGQSTMDLGIKTLLCVGDPIRRQDFSFTAEGLQLTQSWPGRLFSFYRNPETAFSWCDCEEHGGGHMHPELGHVEIVNERGLPLPDGVAGEICLTPFGVSGMPCLRYRTGEYAFAKSGRCGCGRNTLRLGPVSSGPGKL